MRGGVYQAIRLTASRRPCDGEVIAEGSRDEVLPFWVPGQVVLAWRQPEQPFKRLPAASLAAVRRKRLRRRLDAKLPLVADQLFEAEIAARPEFFAGVRDAR